MIRFRLTRSALLLACAISAPSLFDAFVRHTVDPVNAVLRLAGCVVFSVVALGILTSVMDGYRIVNAGKKQQMPRRRRGEGVSTGSDSPS
jgi:hypothetical protein